jgi:hypothetical protein
MITDTQGLNLPCPACHAAAGEPCRNYRNQRKATCKARREPPKKLVEILAPPAQPEPELDFENRCGYCGNPTIRGLNSDHCSERCEILNSQPALDPEEPVGMLVYDVEDEPAEPREYVSPNQLSLFP